MLKYDVQVSFGKRITNLRFNRLDEAEKFYYRLVDMFNQYKPKELCHIRLYKVYVQKVREIQESTPTIQTIFY